MGNLEQVYGGVVDSYLCALVLALCLCRIDLAFNSLAVDLSVHVSFG